MRLFTIHHIFSPRRRCAFAKIIGLPGEVMIGARPVPESETVSGLPLAPVKATLSDAVRAPVAVGRNVTLIVHVEPFVCVPQLLVSEKSPESAPVKDTLVTVIVAPLAFVSVNACGLSELALPTDAGANV